MTIVDIGCGASCVYSLLGSKIFPETTKIIALEPSLKNYEIASKNLSKNNIKKVQILLKTFEDFDEHFDLCLCNPPFYEEKDEEDNRSGRRKKGKFSSITGHSKECQVDGGEVEYVKNIINWSEDKETLLNSSMLGKKSSIDQIMRPGVPDVTNLSRSFYHHSSFYYTPRFRPKVVFFIYIAYNRKSKSR